jgi:trypsin
MTPANGRRVYLALALTVPLVGALSTSRGRDVASASSISPVAAVVANVGDHHEVVCSAVLVTENTLLTAAHCIVEYASSGVFAAFGPRVDAGTRLYRGSVAVDARYSPEQIQHDLAAITLTQTPDIVPIAVASYEGEELLGDTVTSIGYGLRTPSRPPPSSLRRDSVRRTSEGQVAWASNWSIMMRANRGGLCHGDSGAPVIAQDGRLVAIVLAGESTCEGLDVALVVSEQALRGLLAPHSDSSISRQATLLLAMIALGIAIRFAVGIHIWRQHRSV